MELKIPDEALDTMLEGRLKNYAAALYSMCKFDPDDLMTFEEAAKFMKMSKSNVYGLRDRHGLPVHKLGALLYLYKPELKIWILSHDSRGRVKDIGGETSGKQNCV
ncbi:MAG: hypothetical protein Ta2A_07720 [Treponemataceae bacterium]|nr:MAG: hypothetical protein Ta2A_07720 [Treponemataceae bacterium]